VEVQTERDRVFRFGPFELSERDGELRKSGVRIKLQEQPFLVLVELVGNSGKVVSREDLHKKLWTADTFVDFDVGLNSAIRKLRQALNDDAENPRYIETLAKRGYRFVAPVTEPTLSVPDSPSKISDSILNDGAPDTSPDVGGYSRLTAVREWRRWYLALAVLAATALVIYGAVVYRAGLRKTHLATEQQVTANPQEAPIVAAVVSPDGRFVAYADTTGVYIRHIDTGEIRPLQLPEGFYAIPTGWFPDGTHLLLDSGEALYFLGPPSTKAIPSLWKVSLLGGSPQKLMDNASRGAVSPDGSKIAFFHADAEGSKEVWVMGSDGNNPRRIVEAAQPEASRNVGDLTINEVFTTVTVSGVAWSPDGGRLAYIRRFEAVSPGPTVVKHSLETVDLIGGKPRVLMTSTQLLQIVCWVADGRLLYGYRNDPADERVDSGVWSLRVNQKSGEPEGKEEQLTAGAGTIAGLSVTRDGKRLVLWRDNLSPAVFLTEIDLGSHSLSRPRRLTLDKNSNYLTDWTPDSRAVLFFSNRNGTYKVFRQAIDQAVPEVLIEGHGIFQPRTSPDGTQILYLTGYNPEDPAHPVSVMAVPLGGGPARIVLQMPFIATFQCLRSPMKRCVLETAEQLLWFDPEDGKVQPFYSLQRPEVYNWMVSPLTALNSRCFMRDRNTRSPS
jgi:DNA-binding winged helix-turn-helix (wHTH) protein/Tol biopolymer transport system component